MNDGNSLSRVLGAIDKENKFYIDIGSGDRSNIPGQLVLDADRAIFCEGEKRPNWSRYSTKNENFTVLEQYITPDNVLDIFSEQAPPEKYGSPRILDIDIDGYDYFVLEKILTLYTPSILITEINEKIPPPIKFTVKYIQGKDKSWDGSHFYGCSISKYYELLKESYDLIDLSWNNAYWTKKAHTPENWTRYTDFRAYEKFYSSRNWKAKFRHNHNVSSWLEEPFPQALELIEDFFSKQGKHIDKDYELYL